MSIRALLSRADGTDTDVDLADVTGRIKQDELLWADARAPTEDEVGVLRTALRLSEASAEAVGSVPSEPAALQSWLPMT